MKGKITKRLIDTMGAGAKDLFVWDTELIGFGLKVTPAGRKIYICQYRAGGRVRRYTIGLHGHYTPEEARREAARVLGKVADGQDPLKEKTDYRKAPILKELAERYLEEHAATKKKLSSYKRDKSLIDRFIVPALGWKKVDEVTRGEVAKLHHDIGQATPIQANRALACLSKMMTMAIRWGWKADETNPCRLIERYKENKRERFLSGDELARLGAALAEVEREGSELPSVVTAVRLLLFTGCRRDEILSLKWEHVDFQMGCLRLPDSKTGSRMVTLATPASEVLASTERLLGNPYVCPGMRAGGHLVGITRPWERICERAGLVGLRLHDLRHSFASVGAAAGLGLPIIGKLLGHTQAATTQRYAHLHQDPLRAAAEEITQRIAEALRQPVGGKVVPFPGPVGDKGA